MPQTLRFRRLDGLELVGDSFGPENAPGVLFAHGGGQTRHAWGPTARDLASRGWRTLSVDLRGHGDSDWAEGGDYALDAFAHDLLTVAETFVNPPALVGASLGGLAGLIAQGELVPGNGRGFSALILVDVTPRVEQEGVDRIRGFMSQHVDDGFASLDEAAAVIAAYLPHRPPPKNLEGLRKNLRLGEDGRYRWHWDPRFVSGERGSFAKKYTDRLQHATRRVDIPTLLVRGGRSEVVSDAVAKEFLELLPHARYANIGAAGHMVAGDENNSFTDAVIAFLESESEGARS